jgi:hypothetical protein
MLANEILLSATDTIRERGLSYGHPADNLQHTAMLLSAYLQTPIHDYQVAGIMVLLNLQGLINQPSRSTHGSTSARMAHSQGN